MTITKKGNSDFNSDNLILFLVVLTLLTAQFVYYQNTVLVFSFWLFLGLLAGSWCNSQKSISEGKLSAKNFSDFSLISKVFLIILGVFLGVLYFLGVKFYLADHYFLKGIQAPNLENQISNLEKAVNLNPYQAQYRIFLSRAYLNDAIEETIKSAKEQNMVKVGCDISLAIAYAKGQEVEKGCLFPDVPIGEKISITGATQISPNGVAAWENWE